jgi:hypothetical protein
VISVFLFSFVSVLVLGLYPIVELLVLTGLVVDVIDSRFGLPLNLSSLNQRTLDVETRSYNAVNNAGRGIKGFSAVFLVVVFGLFIQVFLFALSLPFVWNETIPFLITTVSMGVSTLFGVGLAWNTVGVGSSLLTASLYGVWYWTRMLDRLPAFLDEWAVQIGKRDSKDAENDVTRPVGILLPAALAIAITVFWIAVTLRGSDSLQLTGVDILYAIAWPATMILMFESIRRTGHAEPQPAESDASAIPFSLVVQSSILYSVEWLTSIRSSGSLSIFFAPFATFTLITALWIFYLGDVSIRVRSREDNRRYAFPAYIGLLAVVRVILGRVTRNGMSEWYLLFGLIVLFGAIMLAVDAYASE